MMSFLIFMILGCVKIRVTSGVADFVTFITKENLRFNPDRHDGYTFVFLLRHAKIAEKYAAENGIEIEVFGERGFPRFFRRYGKRYGAFVGAILACIIVAMSCNVVWQIDIVGNNTVSDEEIKDNLASLGFSVGSNFRHTDFDTLRRRYLIENDDLSWLSVNMKGTHATVEVRELMLGKDEDTSVLSNIVASESGVIVLAEVEEGKACVVPGDYVAKGDLLIGCMISSGEDRLRFETAKGKVLACVERTFSYDVPLKREKNVPTGSEITEKEIIFFKKRIKISGNGRISYKFYDTIDEVKYMYLPHSVTLPIGIHITTYKENEKYTEEINAAEAALEAEGLFGSLLNEALDGGELLSLSREDSLSDGVYTVKCDISCLCDIAEGRSVTDERKNENSEG